MDLVELKRSNGAVVLVPRGYLAGGEETETLERLLFETIDRGECPIIDLSLVTFMNSSALQTLFATTRKLSEKGRRLKICSLNRRVKRLFTVTMATVVFEIFENREDALASCTKS